MKIKTALWRTSTVTKDGDTQVLEVLPIELETSYLALLLELLISLWEGGVNPSFSSRTA